MKKQHLAVAGLFVAFVLLSPISGWAGGRSGGGRTTDGRTVISFAMWVNQGVNDFTDFERRLEERIPDVDIRFIALERATWDEQINTRVVGGDIPDIIYRAYQDGVAAYAQQGIIAEVPIDRIRQYAPRVYEATKSYGREVWLATNVNGKNYGIPIMQPQNIGSSGDIWRMDYLEKIGVTKVPETLDEAEAAFQRIIRTDLNGNGKNDTYGFTFEGRSMPVNLFNTIFGAYGTIPNKWMVERDGTLINGLMRDSAKDALAKLADWYKKGYIDPEFVTTDRAIHRQRIAAGNVAYITWGTWYRAQSGGEYYLDATSVDPRAQLVVGPPLKGPSGQSGYSNGASYSSSVAFGIHLLKDEAKLNRCIQLIDELMANTDDNEYIRYGVEGIDWERDPLTGAKVNKHTNANDLAQFGSPLMEGIPGVPSFQARYTRRDNEQYNRYALMGSLKPEVDYINWVTLFADPSITALEADVNPVFLKGLFDIITGARSLNDYEKLRSDWYAGGGQRITTEINRAYRDGGAQMEAIFSKIR